MQAKSFTIVAGVAFLIPSILRGAFNAHHKANLTKAGNIGQVTAEGARFFSNRPRMSLADMAAVAKESGYALCPLQDGAITWALNAQGAWIQPGSGKLGQSLFAYALSDLTQAAKAKVDAESKAKAPAKPKASKAKAQVQVKA